MAVCNSYAANRVVLTAFTAMIGRQDQHTSYGSNCAVDLRDL